MGKCAKMIKMSCQNAVPKCAKVITLSNTECRLPYLKVTFQGFMGLECEIMAIDTDNIDISSTTSPSP
jgi:hypothetical protein